MYIGQAEFIVHFLYEACVYLYCVPLLSNPVV